MADLLTVGFFELLDSQLGQFLDIGVIDNKIVEVHDEEVDDFVVFEVVPAHFVESILRLKDVIAKVKNDKPVVDHLNHVVV